MTVARFHALAGVAIALVLFSLPHWLVKDAPVLTAHRGASSLHFDEAVLYAPGARRFADTGRPAWELDVFEMRAERFAYPITHQVVLGFLAKIVGGVERAFVIAHTVLPACIWLGFFGLMLRVTNHASWSALASWMALTIAAAPRNALLLGADAFLQPLEMMRTPHPALSTALLLLALWGFLQCLGRARTIWLWFTGPLLGLLFYTYYFHAVAAWTAAGCVFLFSRGAWRRLALVLASGVVTIIPYVAWTAASMRAGNSRALMIRIGEFTRSPDWLGIAGLVVSAGAFITLAVRRKKEHDTAGDALWLIVALLTGAFVVTNLHLITGYNAQHEHAYNRLIQPFGFLLAAMLFIRWLHAGARGWLPATVRVALPGILIVGVIGMAAARQTCVARAMPRFAKESAAQSKLLEELDRMGGECVVGVLDEEMRALLPALTPHWSFVPMGFRTLASNEEILTRFIVVAKLSAMSRVQTLALLTAPADPGRLRTFCYGLLDDFVLKAEDAALFEQLWVETDPATALQSRKLDVLVLPPGQSPAQAGVTLTPLFAHDGWNAYRVTSPPVR